MRRKNGQPRGYQRACVGTKDIVRAMQSHAGKWVSLTELTGMLSDKIAPDEAVRFFVLYSNRDKVGQIPLWMQIEAGKRQIVSRRAGTAWRSGKLARNPQSSGSEPLYMLVEDS